MCVKIGAAGGKHFKGKNEARTFDKLCRFMDTNAVIKLNGLFAFVFIVSLI